MRRLSVTLLLLAQVTWADDAGTKLTAAECSALIDSLVALSVNEALAGDPEVKKMNPEAKAATTKAAKKQSAESPKLAELKRDCLTSYTVKQRDCIKPAKTLKDVEECLDPLK